MKERYVGRASAAGAGVRPVRRDHRRDRRVRPARPLQLGGGIPRRRRRRLRPHAGARGRLAQPHDQHRHRLRLRRQADGPALAGAGTDLGRRRRRTYAEPARPFLPEPAAAPALSAQQQHDDVLDLADVTGKRIVATRLHHNVTIREENATAALEVMSRFAADPKWLIYLPPTMSPTETTDRAGLAGAPAARRSTTSASQGVGKVDLPGKAHGLAGGGGRLPRRGAPPVRALRRRAASGAAESSTPAPAGGSSTTGRSKPSCSTSCAQAIDGRRLLGRIRQRLVLPGLRADALVGQGAGPAADTSTPPSARRRGRRWPRSVRGAGAGRSRDTRRRTPTVAELLERHARAAGSGERSMSTPTAGTAGR